ncbi:MAG: ABC transporter permease [Agathobacter sp.]|nr:ABC transporter permease [Agathobacter sp.]
MLFLKMAWLNFKGQRAAFNLEEFLLLETAYPFMTLMFHCVMAGYAFDTTNLTEWVIGNAFLLCTNICVFSLGSSFRAERAFGRIRSIMTGKTSKIEIVLQKGFFSGLVSIGTTFAGFMAGCVVFGISLVQIPWVGILLCFITAMFAATGFGLVLSVFGLMSHQMHLILNLMEYVLLIFTGSNFPITQLPEVFQVVSYVLPLTRSIAAARGIVNGMEIFQVLQLLGGELFVGIVYMFVATALVTYAEQVAIKKGTLELF